MDFGLIALIVVGAGKVLDYVAPRTKNKIDDKVREGFGYVLGFLPFVNRKLADEVDKAKKEPPEVMARTVDNQSVRDHRSK